MVRISTLASTGASKQVIAKTRSYCFTALGLSKLQPPLDFLNARNLQSHDLWHIAAGYETTVLHEFAIAAFQLAQFGHNYSGNLMAVMTGIAALGPATGFPILMDAVLTAWVHGCMGARPHP